MADLAATLGFVIDRKGGRDETPKKSTREVVKKDTPIDDEPTEDVHEPVVEVKKKRPRSKQHMKKPVWVDEDDSEHAVNLVEHRRTRKFRKKMGEKIVDTAEYEQRVRHFYATKASSGAADWATLPAKDEEESTAPATENHSESRHKDGSDSDCDSDSEDEGLGAHVARLSAKSGLSTTVRAPTGTVHARPPLRAGVLRARRVTDLTKEVKHKSILHSVDFHPTGRLALTAGLDRAVRVFQVDGTTNPRIHGAWLKDLRVSCAAFAGRGSSVVISGSQRHLYRLDLGSGRVARHRGFGSTFKTARTVRTVNDVRNRFVASADGSQLAFPSDSGRTTIVQESTMQQIGTLHVPGRIAALAFDPKDENKLGTLERDGVVRLWDARTWSCVDAHRDSGTVHGASLALGTKFYAVGSDVGIVNVYERHVLGAKTQGDDEIELSKIRTETPLKVVDNLTTFVSSLCFNADNNLLVMASRELKDAVKVLHTPSMSVYANWPANNARIWRVQNVAFSPGSGWLACGNDSGEARLYRLASYPAN